MELHDERPPAPRIARAITLTAGVTQTELAAALGVHRTTVSRWESSNEGSARRPRGELAKAYARLLRQLQDRVSLP